MEMKENYWLSKIRPVFSRMTGRSGPVFRIITGFFLLVFIMLLVSGCPMKGTTLVKTGTCWLPQMAWDGKQMGIVFYHQPPEKSGPDIKAIAVNKNGSVAIPAKVIVTGPLSFNKGEETTKASYSPSLSNLVWNNTDKQYAFAYSKGSWLYIVRLDQNLNQIGNNWITYEDQYLSGLSLVWNSESKEYCLTYIIDPPSYAATDPEWKISDIRCVMISPQGTYVSKKKGISLRTCSKYDATGTSVVYNKKTAEYAVAYLINSDPMICFFNSTGKLAELKLATGTTYKYSIRMACDPQSFDYLVAEHLYGGDIGCQLVTSGRIKLGAYFTRSDSYGQVFWLSPYALSGAHQFILGGSRGLSYPNRQVACWLTGGSKHINPDFISSSKTGTNKHPCIVVLGGVVYIAWIKNDALCFDQPKL